MRKIKLSDLLMVAWVAFSGAFLLAGALSADEPPCHHDFEWDPEANACIRRARINIECDEFNLDYEARHPLHRVIVDFTSSRGDAQVLDLDVAAHCAAEAAGDK